MHATVSRITLFLISIVAFSQTQLTVYNHGQALVKEKLQRQVRAGVSEIEVENVAETLNPSSVKLGSEGELQILEQNYRYDLVNQNKLLKKYLGAGVTVVLQNDKKIAGELLSFDNSTLVIKGKSGTDIIQRNYVGSIRCPTPKERIYVRPTLSWTVNNNRAGAYDLDLSYLAGGVSWQAEYVAIVNDAETEIDLSSWINLRNNSGKDFVETKLKLVAGDLQRARQGQPGSEMMFDRMVKAAPVVEERQFFDYHLYEIANLVSVNNREEKQIQWLSPTPVTAKKAYVFENGGNVLSNLPVKISFINDKDSGTGVALPAGVVRMFKRDTDGALELIGEDNIQHTSRDDKVSLQVGKAFDVKGKKEILDRRSKQDRYREEDYRVTLVNRKDEPVTIDVIQHAGYGNWTIKNAEMDFEKLDASRIKFIIDVPANMEKTFTYTVYTSLK
ncbi:MAG: DUF4139 domain-containing protein [Candidatus Marinimicrobia bacterium]|nr:DUF4139 domain-containing protein [Candidatus Neomarinimicrobiota bacterium]MCF7903808.1 DUF4139 domain-containing protein [Candidatus Neomarinimicrobiota bacterium]